MAFIIRRHDIELINRANDNIHEERKFLLYRSINVVVKQINILKIAAIRHYMNIAYCHTISIDRTSTFLERTQFLSRFFQLLK